MARCQLVSARLRTPIAAAPRMIYRGGSSFCAAGAAAEELLFGNYQEHGCSQDRRCHAILEKRWRATRAGGWEQDIQSAAKVLDRESVEKVARELDRKKKLSDEEVYESLGCKPDWY
jgi:hypothetical protein